MQGILPRLLGHVLIHATGYAAVFTALLYVHFTPAGGASLYQLMSTEPTLASDLWRGIAVHAGLSGAMWFMVASVIHIARRRRQVRPARVLKLQAGTTMIETLIVLPVWLMLVFGLMQLSVNNIASVLVSYAGFAGARTVWVWDGEQQSGRRGVDQAAVLERARISIAMAMTPVATGEFFNDESALSDEAKRMRKGMHGRFSFLGGDAAIMMATTDFSSNRQAFRSNKSFWRAIDSESFSHRAVRKFTRAYLATEVGGGAPADSESPGLLVEGGQVGLRFSYQHHQTMPVVSALFGERGTSGGRGGYFNELRKEHTLPRQRHVPSANWPQE